MYEKIYDISDLKIKLNLFQKKLKYGLNSKNAISIYEMGFVDKFISLELSALLGDEALSFGRIKRFLKRNNEAVENILVRYPSYFIKIYKNLK